VMAGLEQGQKKLQRRRRHQERETPSVWLGKTEQVVVARGA